MRSLSKEAEAKLLDAIERAAALVNDGASPNDAIIKVAKAANIPAGHIGLVVHAYNTGRTNKQREAGVDPLEKSADFPLADFETVLAALYPKEVKTAAERHRAEVVAPEYALSPSGMLARRRSLLAKEAAAGVKLPAKTYTPYPRDEHAAAMRNYSKKQAEKRDAEELRRQVTTTYNKAAMKMETLQEYFRRPGNYAFNDVVAETELRHGPAAAAVLKKLSAAYPFLTKQAGTSSPIIGDCAACDLAAEILADVSSYTVLREKLAAQNAAANTDIKKKASPAPITGSILFDVTAAPIELKSAAITSAITAPIQSTYNFGTSMLDGASARVLDKSPEKMRTKALLDLTDPEHEKKLHTIRSRGVLHDLMLNDPVIGGYDPHDVANAYNELAELAPSYTSSSAAMSALLRKRLEAGQLADFDIKQIVELESAKAQQKKNLADAYQQQMG